MNANWETTIEKSGAGRRASAKGHGEVVCAVLMPHAPILVPAVGGARGGEAIASFRAMREAASAVLRAQPESVVMISPHSPRQPGAFGFWADDPIAGSFAPFGAPQVQASLPNDRHLLRAIISEASARNVRTWLIRHRELDHGALVPMWFLAAAGWSGPTVLLSLNYPGEGGLTSLGEAIAAAANTLSSRIAVVASGDMSHRLKEGAPCGFHPGAHRFDETFVRHVRAGEYRKILSINAELRELAAEDVADSTIIAAAASGWDATGHRLLNYEGPFGVGYGVAILFAPAAGREGNSPADAKAQPREGDLLPGIARRSVQTALRSSIETAPLAGGDYLSQSHGVFVTIRHQDGRLRGCVGTIEPASKNLIAETWRNARLAALRDARFTPVSAGELPGLRFHVSVVHSVENIASPAELNPSRYGLIVSVSDGRRGVLLPGIESIKTVEQQIQIARQKAWIGPGEPVKLQRFQVDEFTEKN